MSIFDRLKPKYRNSNPLIRIKGIEELDDDAILLDLTLNDKEKEVRRAAFNKIKFPGYFPLITARSHDRDIQEDSFNKITNSEDFAKVVRLSKDKILQKKAINKISKVKILEKLKSDMEHSLHPEIDDKIKRIQIEDVERKEHGKHGP